MKQFWVIWFFRITMNVREHYKFVQWVTSNDIQETRFFPKLKASLVWFDAPFYGESEYGPGFYFWPYFSEVNCQKELKKVCKKVVFQIFGFFTAESILSLSSSKQKHFENIFLLKYLEIKTLQALEILSISVIIFYRCFGLGVWQLSPKYLSWLQSFALLRWAGLDTRSFYMSWDYWKTRVVVFKVFLRSLFQHACAVQLAY